MPSYQKLQCRLSAPYIRVACDGGLQRKKINTDDHLSMCSCSGGTELDKAAKFRISRSAWCTFSRGEQIRGYVHRENEHRGAHFRGWCTNSLANLCAGARLRGGERIRCYTGSPTTKGFKVRFKRQCNHGPVVHCSFLHTKAITCTYTCTAVFYGPGN